jgi:hypothetical protein
MFFATKGTRSLPAGGLVDVIFSRRRNMAEATTFFQSPKAVIDIAFDRVTTDDNDRLEQDRGGIKDPASLCVSPSAYDRLTGSVRAAINCAIPPPPTSIPIHMLLPTTAGSTSSVALRSQRRSRKPSGTCHLSSQVILRAPI